MYTHIPYQFSSLYIDKVETVFGSFNFSKAIWSHWCLRCGCNDALFLKSCKVNYFVMKLLVTRHERIESVTLAAGVPSMWNAQWFH